MSLKIIRNGTIGQIIHDLLLVELFDVEYYRDLQMWVTGHSRSLKIIPFKSLDTVSYSHLIITKAISLAVCEISSVKGWCDLENWATGCTRSLKMSPLDYTTCYWSAIVAVSCTIFELFGVE